MAADAILRCWLRCVLLLAISSHAVPAGGADTFAWQPVLPEELKMTSEPQAPGAPAIYLYRQVDRDDQTGREENYARIKILTEEGRKNADVQISFVKDLMKVRDIKARTIRPDGSIADFDGQVYEKTIVKTKGVRVLAKTLSLPDVQIGSIIEYRYITEWDTGLLYNSNWTLSEELFIKHAKFSLKPNTYWQMRWSWDNLPPGSDPPKFENHVVRLDVHDIPPFHAEDYMPPENELKAHVNFAYGTGFGSDSDKFWKDYGQEKNTAIDAFMAKPKAMNQAAGEIVAPGDTPEVKLQKIYARVQELRNLSYSAEKTGQEEKREKLKDTNNVEDIWKHGYGSGRGMNWLFVALARAAGFEAFPVLISERSQHFFHPKYMNSFELNDSVVLVKLNGKDFYCDPGTKFAPYGLLPWSETGVPGLKLDKDGGAWIQTPMPDPSSSKVERKADLKLTEEGTLEGKLTVVYSGLTALWRRIDERAEDDAERKKFLEDQVKEYVPAGIEVELTNRPDWGSSTMEMVAEYKLTVPNWSAGAGHRTVLAATLFGNGEKHTFEHAGRVFPIYFHFPYEEVDDLSIALPAGWQVVSTPAEKTRDEKLLVYSLHADDKKTAVHVSRDLKVNVVLLDSKYYAALRNFYEFIRTADDEQIVLQPTLQ